MRWTLGGTSGNIEDRRNDGCSGGGGGGDGFRLGTGGFLVLGLLSLVFKTDLISPFLAGGERK